MVQELYTLRPIERWPGEMTAERIVSPFSAVWDRTLELLERELWYLSAEHTVLQMAIAESDFRKDGGIRSGARPAHPGVILVFDSKFGPMQYACDRFVHWKDNARAIALALEALRKVDRYGITKRGEQYTGWKALPDVAMTRTEAEALLRSYGGEAEALRRTHPDHGGQRAEFERVLNARRLLRGA